MTKKIAKLARQQLESQLGHSIISPTNAKKLLGEGNNNNA